MFKSKLFVVIMLWLILIPINIYADNDKEKSSNSSYPATAGASTACLSAAVIISLYRDPKYIVKCVLNYSKKNIEESKKKNLILKYMVDENFEENYIILDSIKELKVKNYKVEKKENKEKFLIATFEDESVYNFYLKEKTKEQKGKRTYLLIYKIEKLN